MFGLGALLGIATKGIKIVGDIGGLFGGGGNSGPSVPPVPKFPGTNVAINQYVSYDKNVHLSVGNARYVAMIRQSVTTKKSEWNWYQSRFQLGSAQFYNPLNLSQGDFIEPSFTARIAGGMGNLYLPIAVVGGLAVGATLFLSYKKK